MEVDQDNSYKRELLYKALEDNQNTIRFTDTKAGAVFILNGIIFAFIGSLFMDIINFHRKIINILPNNYYDVFLQTLLLLLFLGGLVCLYLSILLSIKAVSPKSGPIGSINVDSSSIIPNIFYLFKVNPKPLLHNVFNDKDGNFKLEHKFSELENDIKNLEELSVNNVLIVELQKISIIRELKIQRVKNAMTLFIWGLNLLLVKALIVFLITIYY